MARQWLVALLLCVACGNSPGGGPAAPPALSQSGSGGQTTAGSGGETSVAGGGGETTIGGSAGTGGGGADGGGGGGGVAGMGNTVIDACVAGDPVPPRSGCGLAPDQVLGDFVEYHMQTCGTKDASASGNPGPWSLRREFFVRLPSAYDSSRAYPLVLQAPGCGGDGEAVFPLPDISEQAIRVGLSPPPVEINDPVASNQGCFDDREGDDSVEWPFYEAVIDWLKARFCFDENLVFATGNSSGAYLANQLGCIYSGHADYPIRAIAARAAGLRTEPEYMPTCAATPMAGMWVHEINDPTHPFAETKEAISRAMQVNGCTLGTDYDTATLNDYPIGGGIPDDTCKKIEGCPDSHPLVVCPLPGSGKGSNDYVVNPGFAVFLGKFSSP